MKKSNNKGFSLVELIVVVAIMAVLVGVLAPAYLKYVEKSRAQKDASALEEVRHAVEIAIAEEGIYDQVNFGDDGDATTTTTTVTVTVTNGTAAVVVNPESSDLSAEIASTVGELKMDSKEYKNGTYTITLESQTKVSGAWS